jgi:hypothetical protein
MYMGHIKHISGSHEACVIAPDSYSMTNYLKAAVLAYDDDFQHLK